MGTSRVISQHEAVLPGKDEAARYRRERIKDTLAPYLFISPFLLSFLILFLGPAIYSLVLSFYKFPGYGKATWVGLHNYDVTLNYHVFWTQMSNVAFYWIAHLIPLVALSFSLALLISSKWLKGKRVFKPLLFMPQLVAAVAAAMLFKNLFGTEYGLINDMLNLKIPWLQDMSLARWVVVFVSVWRGAAYWFVIFLAGLTSINDEVVEAATVDGANGWQRLVYITLPLMKKTFLVFFVLDAVGSVRIFETPNVLGGSMGGLAPIEMAPVLNLVVDNIRNALFGQAAAVGWLMFIVIAVLSFVQFRLFRER